MDIVAPHLSYEQLRGIADRFLASHHKGGYLPIPIEEIIEFDFNLDIVPMSGLKDEFDVDAFITADLTEIRVDSFIQRKRSNRYRFSLAHELGHLLIHRDVFLALKFTTIKEWKTVLCSIPKDVYGWIEWQAYSVAGLILVPRAPLAEIFSDKVAQAKLAGIDIVDMDSELRRSVESNIGEHFGVSAEVVQRRLEKDNLWK